MFKILLKTFVIFILITSSSESKDFNDVLIKGNNRISNETILVFSDIPKKKILDDNSINLILKNLYETNFFKDVSVKIENNNLLIEVTEYPIIQTIFIEGIKKKSTESSVMDALSLKNRSSFNPILVKQDEIRILNYLKVEGYFFATVISSIQDLGGNNLDLFYKIDLGSKAKIEKISFIGDKKFKNNTLRNIIISEEYKFWKFLSGKKFLNENLVNLDEKLLYNFYKNKGFYNVEINSSFANYLGNNKFELIYNISSGKKFVFNDIILNLPLDYDDTNFNDLKIIFSDLKGKNYSINSINKVLTEIDKIVLNKQFEFLNSTVTEAINDNSIDLTFNITDSEKFYVETINIFGNNITQEDVIRNNFSVDEGDAFNELLQKKTINNLRSLNFFSNVKSEITNGSSNNQKIINITVEEKPTGEISAGAGLGTSGGSVSFNVRENNFLGRGLEFGTNLTVSNDSIKGLIALNNPNYKGTNRSLDFSAESRVTDRLKDFGYKSKKTGFTVGTGYQYYNNLFINTGISSFFENLEADATASDSMKKQKGDYFDTAFNYTIDYDLRNQRYQPTDGFRSTFRQTIPLISDSYTLSNTYNYKIYNNWYKENITSFGFFAKSTNSIAGKDVKLSERIFLPENKLRGFESGKVGPKDGNDFVGGNYALSFNASTTLPQILPNLEEANFSIFFDAANLWGLDYSSTKGDSGKIRSSIGLAVDFFTPIGPLNISLSEPITKGRKDITETFRFNLGTSF